MPAYERPSAGGPRQPTVARPANKLPLTPKVAARTAGSSQHQAPTLATPLARRAAPPPDAGLTANTAGSRDRDDLASPVSAFLSSNVTPRSGSRQSRVDSASSTPNGTPNPDRSDQWETRSGLGTVGDDSHRRPVVVFTSPSESNKPKPDQDSKFFYASDAQKPPPPPASSRPTSLQQPKAPTFFYAKGTPLPERPAPPASLSSQDSLMSKFMYANGTPELQPPAKIGPSPQASGAAAPAASRAPTARPGNIPRAPSPVKSPQLPPPKHAASVAMSPRSPVSATSPQASSHPSHGRVSIDSHSRPKTHSRANSAAFAEPPLLVKRASITGSLPSSGTASPANPPLAALTLPSNPAALGFASLLQAAEDFAEEAEAEEEAQPESSESPTKASPQDEKPIDPVASARRERKVQDLEITNASLEAINRTLERQLRKQTAELRRFQRLSRSGRLSLASMGSRVPSDSTVDGGGLARAGMDLNDLSEEESGAEAEEAEKEEPEEEEEADEADELSGSEASGEMSPRAGALRQEKRREHEKRLELDISKHQQLLVDSQKINQSLKRCLGWTEELIKEGKRALSYQVRPSDVGLGGRVLAPEEVERRARAASKAGAETETEAETEAETETETDDINLDQDDTIYAIDALGRGSLTDTDTSTTWSKDPQDRDSGIELPTEAGETMTDSEEHEG